MVGVLGSLSLTLAAAPTFWLREAGHCPSSPGPRGRRVRDAPWPRREPAAWQGIALPRCRGPAPSSCPLVLPRCCCGPADIAESRRMQSPCVPGGLAVSDRSVLGRMSLQHQDWWPLPGLHHLSAFSARGAVIVYRSGTAFNCSQRTIALNQLSCPFLASTLLLLFKNSHTMRLRFTFDIFYSHGFMSNCFMYFTLAGPAGASRCALCPSPRCRCTAGRAPRQRQVPGNPPRGTELSGDLPGETGAGVTPWQNEASRRFWVAGCHADPQLS